MLFFINQEIYLAREVIINPICPVYVILKKILLCCKAAIDASKNGGGVLTVT